MSKRCHYDFLECQFASCDYFDCSTGLVFLCPRHRNPSGRLRGVRW